MWADQVNLADNWRIAVEYCAGGLPGSEYLWMAAIIIASAAGLLVSRWMISKF
ncbi:MAG: hypothetical protein PWR17_89 [Candidatus Methanomethylophilaceae archaeon]|nr:hypothetical protein [Candidatus Methanomethylophilaceae archaeon]